MRRRTKPASRAIASPSSRDTISRGRARGSVAGSSEAAAPPAADGTSGPPCTAVPEGCCTAVSGRNGATSGGSRAMRAGNMVRPVIMSGRSQPPGSLVPPPWWSCPAIGVSPAAAALSPSVPVAPIRNSCMSGGDIRALGDVARSTKAPSHSSPSVRISAVTRIMNLFRLISPMLRVPFDTTPRLCTTSKSGVASHATKCRYSPNDPGSGSPSSVRTPSYKWLPAALTATPNGLGGVRSSRRPLAGSRPGRAVRKMQYRSRLAERVAPGGGAASSQGEEGVNVRASGSCWFVAGEAMEGRTTMQVRAMASAVSPATTAAVRPRVMSSTVRSIPKGLVCRAYSPACSFTYCAASKCVANHTSSP